MSLSVSHDYTVTGSRIPRTRLLRNSRLSAQSGSRFAREEEGKKSSTFLLIIAKIRENSRKRMGRKWNERRINGTNRSCIVEILFRGI